jgi:hypothetical protein
MASPVATWLTEQDYEVFEEVQLSRSGHRADLVGRRGSTIAVIECKLAFNEGVVEQALWWSHEATFALVAVPHAQRHPILRHACRGFGIGILCVDKFCGVRIEESARMNRHRAHRLDEGLCDGQRYSGMAGNCNSQYWSPFKETCRQLRSAVNAAPGILLKEAISRVRHHYAGSNTARGALRKWIEIGKVEGVRSEVVDRKIRLYPA